VERQGARVHTWRGSVWPKAYGGALATRPGGSPMMTLVDRGTDGASAVVKWWHNIHGPACTCTRLRLDPGRTMVA
jgi:hypothetical protein